MNSRVVSAVLLAVTVALLGTIGYLAWLLQSDPSSRQLLRTKTLTNVVTQIAVRKINSTNNLFAALGARPMSWGELESTNYSTYIVNLRAFGCPEETVRDIIITDVAKLYTRRRADLRARFAPAQFWRAEDPYSGAAGELQRQIRALEREQRDLIRELLGVDLQVEMAKYFGESAAADRSLAFLPALKQEQMRALEERYSDLEQEFFLRSKGFLLEEDHEQLRQLRRQREVEMAGLLTPEEMEEYSVRYSETSQNLRAQLGSFDVTEEEFRKIFKVQKTFDDEFSTPVDPQNENALAAQAQAQQEAHAALEGELKSALGDARFTEYRRAQDPEYQNLSRLADRFALPQDTATKIYDMKVEAQKQAQALQANLSLTDEQRQAALDAVVAATERAVADALPGKVFRLYEQASGQWIRDLGTPIQPPGAPQPIDPNFGQ